MKLNREKKQSYFQSCRTDIQSGVLESRQVGRTFKLLILKHEDPASVLNDSLSLNLLLY